MKTLLAIGLTALLAACPAKSKKNIDDAQPVNVIDAAPAAPMDAQPELPIVRDDRLKLVKNEEETGYVSDPIKLDDKIGFGIIAVTERAGVKLDPAEVTIKFLGNHAEGRWRECLTVVPHLDGKVYEAYEPSYDSKENAALVTETMSVMLPLADLAAMAFAKELKVWLCEDIVLMKPEDQRLLQAMHSELRSPRSVE